MATIRILLILLLSCLCSAGAVITANSVQFPDVSAAVISANPGDTVVIPSGAADWSQTLMITNKGIYLEAAGYYLFPGSNLMFPGTNYLLTNAFAPADTIITNQLAPYAPLIECFLNSPTDTFMRISGFHFECGATNASQPNNNNNGVVTITRSRRHRLSL